MLVLTNLSALSQIGQQAHGYTDPDQLAIATKKQELEQNKKSILDQEMGLAEFEFKAQKIRRQLDALSVMSTDEVSPPLRKYASGMNSELKRLELHIETTKGFLEAQRLALESDKYNLKIREDSYKNLISSQQDGHVEPSTDTWGDKIRKQNERMQQELAERQGAIALQNQRLIEMAEDGFALRQPPPPAPPRGSAGMDATELSICLALEQKVSQAGYDIAEVNLLAAKGLPGAESIDIEKSLKVLDLWAGWVQHETDRHLYKFQKAPEEYNNSEAYFRILMMVCVLQEDFKICYNKDPKMRAGPVEVSPTDFSFFGKPQDLFIHGLTEAQHQGTCASMPVLYVAVGRRLGYPLKLVECKGHLFVRWDDGKERFNIEGTSRGLNCFPDEEYMEWPWPISKEELETSMYMKSLSPRRELAAFLELRALCFKQHGRNKQFATVKTYGDSLRTKEGVDLDRLVQLLRDSRNKSEADGSGGTGLLFQTLTNTNSWRDPGNRRGSHETKATFHSIRVDSE